MPQLKWKYCHNKFFYLLSCVTSRLHWYLAKKKNIHSQRRHDYCYLNQRTILFQRPVILNITTSGAGRPLARSDSRLRHIRHLLSSQLAVSGADCCKVKSASRLVALLAPLCLPRPTARGWIAWPCVCSTLGSPELKEQGPHDESMW